MSDPQEVDGAAPRGESERRAPACWQSIHQSTDPLAHWSTVLSGGTRHVRSLPSARAGRQARELDQVKDVGVSGEGELKYMLMRVTTSGGEAKLVVRGDARCGSRIARMSRPSPR